MNLFDIVIIVVLGYCVIRGIFRGIVKEISAIAAILAGFYAAYMYHGQISPLLSRWIPGAYLSIAAFVLLFCGVFFVITLAGILIRMVVNAALLGVVDRIFGAVFGAVKAILLVTLVYILLITFLPAGGMTFIRGSKLAQPVVAIGRAMVAVMPEGVKKTYDRKLEKFKKGWRWKT